MKKSRGVSMVALVISIIVILILAAIVFSVGDSIDEATEAKVMQQLSEVRKGVSTVRLANAKGRHRRKDGK